MGRKSWWEKLPLLLLDKIKGRCLYWPDCPIFPHLKYSLIELLRSSLKRWDLHEENACFEIQQLTKEEQFKCPWSLSVPKKQDDFAGKKSPSYTSLHSPLNLHTFPNPENISFPNLFKFLWYGAEQRLIHTLSIAPQICTTFPTTTLFP